MRKLLTFLIGAAMAVYPMIASAQTPQVRAAVLNYRPPPSGGGDAAETTAFLARADAITTVGALERAVYKSIINTLVSRGYFSRFDGLWVLATDTMAHAKLNLVSSSFSLVYNGTPAESSQFVADVGYHGDGSTVYLDTQLEADLATKLTLNGASLFAFIHNNRTSTDSSVIMGAGDFSSHFTYLSPLNPTTGFVWDLNGGTFPSQANTGTKGAWAAVRNASASTTNLFNNGSATPFGTNSSDTSATIPAGNIVLFNYGRPGPGVGSNFSSDTLSAAAVGGAFSNAEAADVQSIINTGLGLISANVY